ncbi:FlaG/FlaF family flagellin (archaellin) [Methanomicrobium sp. W14]|uniref:type IV pilin N-terminal domain-containing protein n=1 Tax=Methanomicrobium sp. W14 TaxID=2817839 RepID=UPI001AE8FE71|nr:type IV pilin N-terminal domain-containing protein [Methanomicrobium sp. W14]MBP2134420.1 FlaG/FlaF family flagellin (archaellin) [Methanomicrobium sp. W14]
MMKNNDSAVSPVVGVMLMLVVTIIIAAVVSGFAGGFAQGQTKAPQATIQGEFSTTSGLKIIHAGGEAIPTTDMVITLKNGPTFGSNLEAMSTNALNLATVTDSNSVPVQYFNPETGAVDGYNITSFNPGDTFYVNIANCDPEKLQPTVAPYDGKKGYKVKFDGTHYTYDGFKTSFWNLCFVNQENIGKSFYLDVNDKSSGTLISRAVVTIKG